MCNLLAKLVILKCHHRSSTRIHHHHFLVILSSKPKAGWLDLRRCKHTYTSDIFILVIVLRVGVSESLSWIVHNLATFTHHLISLVLYLTWISRVILVYLSHTSSLRKSLLVLSKLHAWIISSQFWRRVCPVGKLQRLAWVWLASGVLHGFHR